VGREQKKTNPSTSIGVRPNGKSRNICQLKAAASFAARRKIRLAGMKFPVSGVMRADNPNIVFARRAPLVEWLCFEFKPARWPASRNNVHAPKAA